MPTQSNFKSVIRKELITEEVRSNYNTSHESNETLGPKLKDAKWDLKDKILF